MNVRTVTLGTLLIASGFVCVASAGESAEPKWKGSIKVLGTHTESELAKMAKIALSDAEKIALRSLGEKDAEKEILASELEVEDGYLIYSVEIKVTGKEGVDELLIDAGSGKVLAREHESDEAGEGEEGQEGQQGDAHTDDHHDDHEGGD